MSAETVIVTGLSLRTADGTSRASRASLVLDEMICVRAPGRLPAAPRSAGGLRESCDTVTALKAILRLDIS